MFCFLFVYVCICPFLFSSFLRSISVWFEPSTNILCCCFLSPFALCIKPLMSFSFHCVFIFWTLVFAPCVIIPLVYLWLFVCACVCVFVCVFFVLIQQRRKGKHRGSNLSVCTLSSVFSPFLSFFCLVPVTLKPCFEMLFFLFHEVSSCSVYHLYRKSFLKGKFRSLEIGSV